MNNIGQKTYWHLMGERRIPREYEIVSSKLHYYPSTGFEVNFPARTWHQKYYEDSSVALKDWEKFQDPKCYTYASYTKQRSTEELHVRALFESIEKELSTSARVQSSWLGAAEHILCPLLFPLHTFQMTSAYIGHLLPGSRVTIACAFQAADHMRHTQILAYWIALNQKQSAQFGERRKQEWETAPWCQPLRELCERLLVTFDWAQSFIALNLCLKPALDEACYRLLLTVARNNNDHLWAEILASIYSNCLWHREWATALIQTLLSENAQNRDEILRIITAWNDLSEQAIIAYLAPVDAAQPRWSLALKPQLVEMHTTLLKASGLSQNPNNLRPAAHPL